MLISSWLNTNRSGLRLTLARCASLLVALVWLLYATSARADTTPFFLKQTGSYYHYIRESRTTFASIQSKIETGYYSSRGVRNLSIYCPYKATDEWRGVPAIDHFSTNPNTGSVTDFGAMVTSAHAHNMAIVIYVGLLFVDFDNALWVKAQSDHKMGIKSAEANMFRWSNNDNGPAAQHGGWAYSDAGQAYYAQSWAHPAIDYAQADGQTYVKSVLKFWLDLGVDGFEYDSPESVWGQTDSLLTDVWITYPKSYSTSPKYLLPEGATASYQNADYDDGIGYTHVLLGDDDDNNTPATNVVNGSMSIDDLEDRFATFVDGRRAAGRGAVTVSNYSDMSAQLRAFEAAVLAGNGAYFQIDYDQIYVHLDAATQKQYDAVFVGLARSDAEAPGATRKRISLGSNESFYAVLRTSGSERVRNVYNFGKQAGMVSVDLTGTGIMQGEVPLELVTNVMGAAVTSNTYNVSLPTLGYRFLDLVKTRLQMREAMAARWLRQRPTVGWYRQSRSRR